MWALGIWTAAAAGGGASGFFLGGVITEGLGWQWIFFLNVPIAILALFLAPGTWRKAETPAPRASTSQERPP